MINRYNIVRFSLVNFFFSLGISSFIIISCSDKSGQKATIPKIQSSDEKQGKPKTNPSDSIAHIASDSLKTLLNAATQDTSRLRILDAMANAENNDDIIAGYNEQIEILSEKILSANPTSDLKNSYLKFLAHAYLRRGNIYDNEGEYDIALEYYNKCLKFSEELGNKKDISATLSNIGNTYHSQGKIPKALEYYKKSLIISEEIGDKTGISRSLNNIGTIYADLDDIPKALEYYNKNLKILEELGDKSNMLNTLNNIGITYSYMGDMSMAMEYYTRCLKISEELGNKRGISASLINLGTIYEYQHDYNVALEYYHKSLKTQAELGDKSFISGTLTNIANVYIDQAEAIAMQNNAGSDSLNELALEYYFESLKISEELGDKNTSTETLINIGQTYDEQGDTLKALEYYHRSLKLSEEIGDKSSISFALIRTGYIYFGRNETAQALSYARKAYNIAKETGYTFNIRDAAELLDKIYARQGNYKLSRQYFGEYITMHDSIVKEENQQLVQKKYFQYQYEKKAVTDSIAHSKAMEISKLEIEQQKAESRRQKLVIGFVVSGLLLVLLLAGYIFRSLRLTRKQKSIIEKQKKLVDEKNSLLSEQNEEIRTQRDEIEEQRDEITAQRDMVTEQKEQIENIHFELTGSIRYAERIQKAVLPSDEYIKEIVADCHLSSDNLFILFKPRDIVSGDFYFFEKRKNILLIAVADCTGHGVPGAFMSMLGISFLNEIIAKEQIQTASQVLDELRDNIIHSLQQKGIEGEQKDGMDITFVTYNTETRTVQYAGAYNPLYLIHNDTKELTEIKPDQMPVAIYENMKPFTNHVIQLQKGDIIYLASDGYGDQFGGPKGKKFLSKRLRQLLTEVCSKPIAEQKEILDKTIEEWKNDYGEKYKQTDDITLIGIKIS